MINANEYFDGNVKSLGYTSAEGSSSIGVMEPGEYKFDTSSHETMIVIQGTLTVQLPGSSEWKAFNDGEYFEVDANQSFLVKIESQSSYLCKYK